jgi:glutaminase
MTSLPANIDSILLGAVEEAKSYSYGQPATYIPELARAPLEPTSVAIAHVDGTVVTAGDAPVHRFTLQSSAKLILLSAMLEEFGPEQVFSVVGSEPSGSSFASLARLETDGPWPSNPLINAGAIALCGQLDGGSEARLRWLHAWVERLYGEPLVVNERVLDSERRTGHRNRAIAHLLKHMNVLRGDVEAALETYFTLCSLECDVATAARLPAILANGGVTPNGARVISQQVANDVVSLMATCGMYDESGTHLRQTGLPAKSGVSGVIVAVASGRAGIAVANARLNAKGGSVRGHVMLRRLSRELRWHFADREHG